MSTIEHAGISERVQTIFRRPQTDEPTVEVRLTYGNSGLMPPIAFSMTPTAWMQHAGNERALFASVFGVPWERIAEWSASDGRIRCSANTRKGMRCRSRLTGVIYENPAEWSKADEVGGYCFAHAQEARVVQ